MKYSGHRKLLCELSKLSKFNAFNLLGYWTNTDASILVYKFRPERTGFNMYAEYTQLQLTFLALHSWSYALYVKMFIMQFAVFCVDLNLIHLDCKLFAMLGGVCGTVSIFTMIMIGYDRYNVIVRGLSAKKITKMKVSQQCKRFRFVLVTLKPIN